MPPQPRSRSRSECAHLAVVDLVLLQHAPDHLLVHLGQRHRAVDRHATRLLLLEVDVGRRPGRWAQAASRGGAGRAAFAQKARACMRLACSAGAMPPCAHGQLARSREERTAPPVPPTALPSPCRARRAPVEAHADRLQLACEYLSMVPGLRGVQHHQQQVGRLAHGNDLLAGRMKARRTIRSRSQQQQLRFAACTGRRAHVRHAREHLARAPAGRAPCPLPRPR